MEDRDYIVIRDALLKRIAAARVDGKGNLQNLNVLLEGFFREFLNILYGWQLVNANAEKQNTAGFDLIDKTDKKNWIVVQVSGKCEHGKILDSLKKTKKELEKCGFDGSCQFYFLPIRLTPYHPEGTFALPDGVCFDKETDILNYELLRDKVQYASAEVKYRLRAFVELEKYDLWERLDALLREEWADHPSKKLMGRDDIDERLFPNAEEDTPFDAMGEDESGAVSPVWRIIAATWRSERRRHVVIEGDGGIGKTVTLFSLANAVERWRPAPAVYVPMHALVTRDGRCVELSAYLRQCDEGLEALARQPWAGAPTLLVLLDGFNEVVPQKRRELLGMLNEWQKRHFGAQLIAVSRPMNELDLARELSGDPLRVRLRTLSRDTVRGYLRDATPPKGAPVWEVLTLPLFLTLYKKTEGLEGKTVASYPLAPKPAESGGALIWNYLQRELMREDSEAWVLRCAAACEYVIPYIAYRMARDYVFTLTLDDAKRYIAEAAGTLVRGKLPRHLALLFEICEEQTLDAPSFDGVDWARVVLQETGVLAYKRQKKACAFPHQNFRDALAGLYLVNQAEAADKDALPEVWRHGQPPALLDYAAELMEADDAAALWEANRRLTPTAREATYAQLEFQKHRAERGSAFEPDFSGMDLRGMSLTHYLREGARPPLFRRAALSVGTRLDLDSFRSRGHSGPVSAVAVTKDGRIVSGSWDHTLRVWDGYTGDCLRVLEGRGGAVECVAVTKDGRIVSGSDDGTLRVWDGETGACLRVLEGHTGWVRCVAALPDGTIVSGSWDGTLRVWDGKTGACLRVLEGYTDWVRCVAALPDGSVVSGSADGTLRVWDGETGACLRVLEGHGGTVRCAAALPDGSVVSGSLDNTLRVWDGKTGACLRALEGHSGAVFCAAALPDGTIVSGSYDNILRVWDGETGARLRVLKGHSGTVYCVAALPDGSVVSGSWDNTLRVWDGKTGACLRVLKGHTNWVSCVAALPDGSVVSGSDDNTLRVWDADSGDCRAVIRLPETGLDLSGADFSQAEPTEDAAELLCPNNIPVPAGVEARFRRRLAARRCGKTQPERR